jgi:hypothetical protein
LNSVALNAQSFHALLQLKDHVLVFTSDGLLGMDHFVLLSNKLLRLLE